VTNYLHVAPFAGRHTPLHKPNPTHLPKHESLNPNHKFSERIWYV